MKKVFLVLAVVMILATAATMTMAATLAEWNFGLASYDTSVATHYKYLSAGGDLTSAYTDIRLAPDANAVPSNAVANWEQTAGSSIAADDKSISFLGKGNAQHMAYASSSASSSNSGFFTSGLQTITISADVRFNQMRYGSYDQNQIFSVGIGQSGNLTQNLFHVNGAVYSSRYPSGGTNPGGVGSPYTTLASDSITNYKDDGTIGANAAVATNYSNLGTRENTVANWRGFAGVSIMKNDPSNYVYMSKFAERGSIGTNAPAVTADPNAIAIAAAGIDGTLGNVDDWFKYTMSIDFSAGTYATYKVYVGNVLQATLTQNLPTGKLAADYWTVRTLAFGPASNSSFSGAIDNIKITNTIDDPSAPTVPEPATLVGLLAFAPALIAVSRRRK